MLTQNDQKKIEEIVTNVITNVLIPFFNREFNIINKKLDAMAATKVFNHDSELVKHDKSIKRLKKTAHLAST